MAVPAKTGLPLSPLTLKASPVSKVSYKNENIVFGLGLFVSTIPFSLSVSSASLQPFDTDAVFVGVSSSMFPIDVSSTIQSKPPTSFIDQLKLETLPFAAS